MVKRRPWDEDVGTMKCGQEEEENVLSRSGSGLWLFVLLLEIASVPEGFVV